MRKRLIKAAARTLSRRASDIDAPEGADKPARNHPRWRLTLHENHSRKSAPTEWILEAVHHKNDRGAARIKDIRWRNTLKQTHRALKTIEQHSMPPGSGVSLSPEQLAELYRLNGSEHGPAIATVEIGVPCPIRRAETLLSTDEPAADLAGGLKYQIHIERPEPEKFIEALNDVYNPSGPPADPPRRWTASEINPRHPRWQIQRQQVDDLELWTLIAVHDRPATESAIRIKRIAWQTKALPDTGDKPVAEPEAEYSPAAIAALIEKHADPETPVNVQISVRNAPYHQEQPRRDAEAIKEIIDTIYDQRES